ncbi:MAG: hypothetical protein QM743_12715 [Chitinophagaceae bacterium]
MDLIVDPLTLKLLIFLPVLLYCITIWLIIRNEKDRWPFALWIIGIFVLPVAGCIIYLLKLMFTPLSSRRATSNKLPVQ